MGSAGICRAAILAAAAERLRPNRFVVLVVGEVRDRAGFYRGLVSDTIAAAEAVGLLHYNEAILVTPAGSLPIRIGAQFGRYRKLGKTHQNVLVFYRGDPKAIPNELGEVQFAIPEEGQEEVPTNA